jgi:predicted acylesterase/phospholipase RssA
MRAAAFSHGVLSELDANKTRSSGQPSSLFDRIDFLSGVSGGAVAAAYFGLKGRTALGDFRERFLMRDAEESLSTSITPVNMVRAYEGGINDSQFTRWLDQNLFQGATLAEFNTGRRPRVFINASDIYNRTPFVFDDLTFSAICSELNSYPIANAIAASAAIPIVFAPVVVQAYSDRCGTKLPDWIIRAQNDAGTPQMLKEFADAIVRYRNGTVPYIKLLDGGLVDNYGLSGFTIARLSASTPYGPLTAKRAVALRRVLLLVVDGGRGPSGDWAQTAEGPNGPDVVLAAVDTAFGASVRASFTAFDRTMAEWHDTLVRWRCGLSAAEARGYGAPKGWSCRDLKFFVGRVNFEQLGPLRAKELSAVPTRFKLPPETVDKLIEAGRETLRSSPTFHAFLSSL